MTKVLFALAVLSLAAIQDEKVENPEYKAWASQKVGAWVKYKMVNDMGQMKMEGETITKLKELTPEKAVIEQITTFEMGGQKQENKTSRTIESKIAKGTDSEGSKLEQQGEGDEELEIKGRKIKCHWVKNKVSGKRGAAVMTSWRTDEVVGGSAKMEIATEAPMKMNMTLTAVDWKAGE